METMTGLDFSSTANMVYALDLDIKSSWYYKMLTGYSDMTCDYRHTCNNLDVCIFIIILREFLIQINHNLVIWRKQDDFLCIFTSKMKE